MKNNTKVKIADFVQNKAAEYGFDLMGVDESLMAVHDKRTVPNTVKFILVNRAKTTSAGNGNVNAHLSAMCVINFPKTSDNITMRVSATPKADDDVIEMCKELEEQFLTSGIEATLECEINEEANMKKQENKVLLIDVVAQEIRMIDTPTTTEQLQEVLGYNTIGVVGLENGDKMIMDESGFSKSKDEIAGWFLYEFTYPVWFSNLRNYPFMNNAIICKQFEDETLGMPSMSFNELFLLIEFQGTKPAPNLTSNMFS
ncbi:MAG: hypothetical protein H7329_19585 [Opitutaceae bacterium]|nr:hypothetical protein [Cytophagales bacterium]